MKPLTPNSVLKKRYQIIKPLKKGGMGQIFLATDLERNHICVVKTTLKSHEAATTQFRKEASLLRKMKHPSLPKIFDYVEQDGHHCLIMEYIPGHDLWDLVQKYGPVKEKHVLLWADQILDALIYMHGRRPAILHRDIKPANIKLVDDKNNIIKLVDFGLARTWYDDKEDRTRTGARAVSAPFSPWEQYGGGQGTEPRSDIYALGVTMFYLLTGKLPMESIYRMNKDTQPSIHTVMPNISKNTDKVIERAMGVCSEDRWESAYAMRRALRRTPSGSMPSIFTPKPTPTPKPKKPTGNSKNDNFILITGMVVVVGIVIFLLILSGGSSGRDIVSSATPTSVTKSIVIVPTVITPAFKTSPVPKVSPTVTLIPALNPMPTLKVLPTVTLIPQTPNLIIATPTTPPKSSINLIHKPLLVAPPNKDVVQYGVIHVFKWNWSGQLPANYGFDIRIWLEGVDNDHYGAVDAKEVSKGLVNKGNGNYEYSFDTFSAYSVQQHGSRDTYKWTVAVVQLEPYVRIGQEAEPRIISIVVPTTGGGGGGGGGGDVKGGERGRY